MDKKKGCSYLIRTVLCGISMISLYPTIHYRTPVSQSSVDVESKAWIMAGNSMKNAITTVDERIRIANGR